MLCATYACLRPMYQHPHMIMALPGLPRLHQCPPHTVTLPVYVDRLGWSSHVLSTETMRKDLLALIMMP